MKKYIIAIKLKNEKYERYYYNKKRCNFGLDDEEFWIDIDHRIVYFSFSKIEYFRIIEQGE